jgi:hypothetical protein
LILHTKAAQLRRETTTGITPNKTGPRTLLSRQGQHPIPLTASLPSMRFTSGGAAGGGTWVKGLAFHTNKGPRGTVGRCDSGKGAALHVEDGAMISGFVGRVGKARDYYRECVTALGVLKAPIRE